MKKGADCKEIKLPEEPANLPWNYDRDDGYGRFVDKKAGRDAYAYGWLKDGDVHRRGLYEDYAGAPEDLDADPPEQRH